MIRHLDEIVVTVIIGITVLIRRVVFRWIVIRPFAVRLDGHLICAVRYRLQNFLDVPNTMLSGDETFRRNTYWSTARASHESILLQMGHVHVGACSCNCKKDSASKHRVWLHTVPRHGTVILSVDTGSFRDNVIDSTSMSGSWAFLFTVTVVSALDRLRLGSHSSLSSSTDCFVMTLRFRICWAKSWLVCFFTRQMYKRYLCIKNQHTTT